ncbi:MAG: RHS repeat-associated core domain-containing protein [Chitinophagales bacterium]|nr:RHS repeat-associated core domain-containing protein [Bacteroidota bacterium]MBK8488307.1 RHS repeat-associated core domain-containing protein [Bacteroidota bacterium]
MKPSIFTLPHPYPFGMLTPGRNWSSGSEYRFGFNGKESDTETYGDGNSYDFGERIYDARLGRWMSVDPMSGKYANLSPYVYTANNPILYIDRNGKDYEVYVDHNARTIIVKATFYYPESDLKSQQTATQAVIAIKRQVNGKFIYEVEQADGTVIDYDIEFDLQAKPSNRIDYSGTYGDDYNSETGEISFTGERSYANTLIVEPHEAIQLEAPIGVIWYGHTDVNSEVHVSDRIGLSTTIHEMGHAFGVQHTTFGAMQQLDVAKQTGLDRLPEYTDAIIQQILFNVGLGTSPSENEGGEIMSERGYSRGDHSIMATEGDAPDNFKHGKVVNK